MINETLRKTKPFTIDFEKILFSQTGENGQWKITGSDLEKIERVNDEYFAGREIVALTTKPEAEWESVKISLDDHFVLFDRIERKTKHAS